MILKRRGTVTGSLATRGFRDVLDIGRQTRPDFSGYSQGRAPALVERERRTEKNERHNADRIVPAALDIGEVEAAALKKLEVAAVAILFMHSYRDAIHEERAYKVVEQLLPHVYIGVSSDDSLDSESLNGRRRQSSMRTRVASVVPQIATPGLSTV